MSDQNMKRRNFALIAGILAISMVAATIVGGQMMTTAAAQEQPTKTTAAAQEQPTKTTDSDKSTVSTSGSATVKVDPDRVTVTIGVDTKGDTAAKAVADNSRIMKRVLDALKGLDITANQTATSNYSVFPIYDSRSPPCIDIYPQPPECAPK
ncbi:MAG: SIMPL domain-containing protein, partial [Nitrososphaera sp.]